MSASRPAPTLRAGEGYAVAPDDDPATALLLSGREAMAGRLERMTLALRVAAEAFEERADACDRTGLRGQALECRRLARECREASR